MTESWNILLDAQEKKTIIKMLHPCKYTQTTNNLGHNATIRAKCTIQTWQGNYKKINHA